jgi:DNA helicase-2/ATP-dependent DNA helicase PcrA
MQCTDKLDTRIDGPEKILGSCDYLVGLDVDQREIVLDPALNKLVAAGPGSGKTRLLVAAVLRETQRTLPARIVAITFTVAAARELEERIAAVAPGIKLGFCGTLHSWLFQLLREHHYRLDVSRPYAVADEAEAERLLSEVAEEFGSKVPKSMLQAAIAEEVEKAKTRAKTEPYIIAKEYLRRLDQANLVTFDQILAYGVRIAGMMNENYKPGCHPCFEAVFWDELQDSSESDWSILRKMPFRRRFGVGDPDQSIYGFRGAKVELFLNGGAEFKTFKLERNYRSSPDICAAASELIKKNDVRLEKETKPASREYSAYGTVSHWECSDPSVEAGRITEFILSDWRNGYCGPEDFAVLCRNNSQVKTVVDWMRALSLPVRERKPRQKPDDWERAKLLLRVAANPYSDIAAFRYIEAKDGKEAAHKALRVSVKNMVSLALTYFPAGFFWDSAIDFLFREAGISVESTALAEHYGAGAKDKSDLLVKIAEAEKEDEDCRDGVTVCTIHAAKGREWHTVFVAGMEQGLLPALRGTDLEEERRVAYVAFTRAKWRLILTWCSSRNLQRGPITLGRQERKPSQFIEEAGL